MCRAEEIKFRPQKLHAFLLKARAGAADEGRRGLLAKSATEFAALLRLREQVQSFPYTSGLAWWVYHHLLSGRLRCLAPTHHIRQAQYCAALGNVADGSSGSSQQAAIRGCAGEQIPGSKEQCLPHVTHWLQVYARSRHHLSKYQDWGVCLKEVMSTPGMQFEQPPKPRKARRKSGIHVPVPEPHEAAE